MNCIICCNGLWKHYNSIGISWKILKIEMFTNKNTKYIPERITNLLRTPTKGKSFQKGLRFLKLCDKRNNTNFLEEWPEFRPYV